jgi:CheY-like chemotaxis protein
MVTRGTVLVAGEASETVADLIAILGRAGYRVLTPTETADERALLRAFRVRLVVAAPASPVPGTDPWAALDRLVRDAPGTRRIVCAPRETDAYDDYAAHGFAACLPAPPAPPELLALVAALLPAVRGDAVPGRATVQH